MESKLGVVMDNLKNVNPAIILETIKKSKEDLKSNALVKALTENILKVEKKAGSELEKVVASMLEKLLKDNKTKGSVSEDVKN